MAELRFEIDNTALDVVRNTVINANFDEMKEALTEFVEPYTSLIVSEDGIKEAKADRARLRKIETSIDEYRKMVKRTYNEPMKVFEDKCKELTKILSDASTKIDLQVKAYEDRYRDEKLMELRLYFNEVNTNPEYCSWEQIENPKWGNATYDFDLAKNDILSAVKETSEDIAFIKELHSEFEMSLLQRYKETHRLADAVALNGSLYQAKERAERERQIAEQKRIEAEKKQKQAQTQEELKTVIVEKNYKVNIEVTATKRQIFEIEKILSDMGVNFNMSFAMGAEVK